MQAGYQRGFIHSFISFPPLSFPSRPNLVACLPACQTYRECQILHHAPHAPHARSRGLSVLSLAHQLLDAAIWVDLHGAQVGEAIDEPGLLSELLREGVGQVVRRVGGDEQHGAAHSSELNGQRAGCRRLPYAPLAADEDPAQRLLVEDRLQCWLEGVQVGVDDGGGHDGGGEEERENTRRTKKKKGAVAEVFVQKKLFAQEDDVLSWMFPHCYSIIILPRPPPTVSTSRHHHPQFEIRVESFARDNLIKY